MDYGFFVGRELAPAQVVDEVVLDCPDGRNVRDAVPKTKALVQYAWDNGYDFLFKCDLDTYVHVPRLLASGFEQHDKPISLECEDWWAARHLTAAGFVPHQDSRYHSKTKVGPQPDNDLITSHLYMDGEDIVHWQDRMSMIREFHLKSDAIRDSFQEQCS